MARDPFRFYTWSYSKLKNYETCPRRFYEIDLFRNIKEAESAELKWGNYLHDRLARAIGTDDNATRREQIMPGALPVDLSHYQPWVDRLSRPRKSGAEVSVEQQLAITADFMPTTWFAADVWYRGIIDVKIVTPGRQGAALTDWKTGKRHHDPAQLAMNAMAVFAHELTVQDIRTEFVWLKDMDVSDPFRCVDRETYKRTDMAAMWSALAPRERRFRDAFDKRDYPPKPSGLCRKYCPVHTCEHFGK